MSDGDESGDPGMYKIPNYQGTWVNPDHVAMIRCRPPGRPGWIKGEEYAPQVEISVSSGHQVYFACDGWDATVEFAGKIADDLGRIILARRNSGEGE